MDNVKCIVLRKIRYGESDLIIHAIDQTGCKMSFIARSALRSRKRFGGGVLEPSHYIQATYQPAKQNKAGELNIMKEASLIDEFAGIKKDYDRLNLAFHVLALVDQMSHEFDLDAQNVFHLLGNTLKALENDTNTSLVKTQFELKLLNYLGVLPRLESADQFLQHRIGELNDAIVPADLDNKIQQAIERYRKGLHH